MTSTNWVFLNYNNQNIGIGTTNSVNNISIFTTDSFSSNQLLITSTCNFANIQLNNGITSNAYIGIGCTNITNNYSCNLFIETNNSIIFNAGGINKSLSIPNLIINSNCNIGINTSNPLFTLDVNGSINASNIIINSSIIPYNTINNNINNYSLSNVIYNLAYNFAIPLKKYPPKCFDNYVNTQYITGTYSNHIGSIILTNTNKLYGAPMYGNGTYNITYSSHGLDTTKYLNLRTIINTLTSFGSTDTTELTNSNLPLFNSNIDSYNNIGIYTGTNFINSSYLGGWIKIQFPDPIVLRKFSFLTYSILNNKTAFYDNYKYLPGSWKCYGSMDNITYTEIPQANSPYRITPNDYIKNVYSYNHYLANTFNTAYTYIVWVINALSGTSISDVYTIRALFEIEICADSINNIEGALIISNNNLNIPSFNTIYGGDGDKIILKTGIKSTTYPYSIGLNTNTMWFSVPINGTYLWYSNLTSNMFLDNTGTLNIFNDVIGFNNASDSNLKTNIKPFDFNCIDLINKIKPVEFTWKDIAKVPENKKNTTDFGFIAQEIEELLPHIVNETTEYKIIKYEKIIPYLVKAIQELDIKLKKIEEE